MKDNEHDYFQCILVDMSAKAVLVKLAHNDQTYWVPASLCEVKMKNEREAVLEVESWFAKKEGMAE